MSRRLALSLVMLAAGAGLLVTAQLGTASSTSGGGILKVGGTGNLDSIDPAIAYGSTSWMFESATAAKLYNYPVGRYTLASEVAKRFTVSKDGRVYRFYLRRGYRFSDGERVTAGSFAYAIRRAQNPHLSSPGGAFIDDPNAVEIVGVSARGLTLTVRLRRPAPALLTTLAVPFFQAASSKLPVDQEVFDVNKVGDLPTAGPYTWSYNNPNHQANIVRNPYYGGPRPRNIDGVEFDMRLNVNDCYNRTVSGDLDLGCLPPDQVQNVAATYGVSRTRPVKTGRFWVKATGCESSLLFNHRRGLFSENAPLRQAVNWAVDRTAVAELSPYATTPWTQILPPGFPGAVTARRLQPYSLRPNLAKARQLAAGHLRDGNIRVAYQSAGRTGPPTAELVRQALVNLGFDSSRIDMRGFAGFNIYEAAGARGTPFDLVVGILNCSYSPDPAWLIGQALNELGDFNAENAAYNRKLAALSRKPRGKARLRALGRFDLEVTKKLAPVAVLWVSNDLTFFSNRVDPASLRYSQVYGWSFTALRLK